MKIPILIPIIIPKGIAKAQIDFIACLKISLGLAILSLDGLYPLFLEIIYTVIIIDRVIRIPGVYPAKNMSPTGTLAINA